MTTAKRQTLVDFFACTACTGQAGVSVLGYAPLPLNLVRAQFDQLGKLHDADPAVDVSTLDPANCEFRPSSRATSPVTAICTSASFVVLFIARIAGLYPAGVICEIMNEDGTMSRLPELKEFAAAS